MRVSLSQEKYGQLAVAGHVGCGHCHSLNNQVQDDSAGLAAVLKLFQEASGLSLVIKDIRVRTGIDGYLEVETESGGIGSATSRRGITIQEASLVKSLIGKEIFSTQVLVTEAFGRFYGQGISETPVAFQTALSNAALNSFIINHPDKFKFAFDDLEDSCGLIAGAILDFDGIPVAVLGTVNASTNGIGPREDLEGNVYAGRKKEVMALLGMLNLPTIVIEAKVYNEGLCKGLRNDSFIVKADRQMDNPFVAASIVNAAEVLGLPVILREDAMTRIPGGLAAQTQLLGKKIADLGEKMAQAEYSQDKCRILSEIALLVGQDGGGVSFMTNRLHEIVGGAGVMPGTSAVINYCVTEDYYQEFLVPFITTEDIEKYVKLTKQAVIELKKVLPDAISHAQRNCYQGSLDELIQKAKEA